MKTTFHDRLKPEHVVLPNGIHHYHFKTDDPFVKVRLVFPFGHSYNTGDIIPGGFHFLEHCVMNRSHKFKEIDELKKKIGFLGGYMNASTNNVQTEYECDIPLVGEYQSLLEGFFDQVMNPLFLQEDLDNEKGVISAERKPMERWFPGSNEQGNYMFTEWLFRDPAKLFQIFGTDEDLQKFTVENISKMHTYYYTNKAVLITGGGLEGKELSKFLNHKTEDVAILPNPYLTTWKDRKYKEKEFSAVSHPEYTIGFFWDKDGSDLPERLAYVAFLTGFLKNTIHGPLYRWLRSEKAWVYKITASYSAMPGYRHVIIAFPGISPEHVDEVRNELRGRIMDACASHDMVEAEKKRILSSQMFDYQTLEERIGAIRGQLSAFGKVFSEEEEIEFIKNINTKDLTELAMELFSDENLGELYIVPKG